MKIIVIADAFDSTISKSVSYTATYIVLICLYWCFDNYLSYVFVILFIPTHLST